MSKSEQQKRDTAELQRLQVGAAIVIGFALLILIVLRALHGHMLSVGWWRP